MSTTTTTDQIQYQPGDVANGYRLAEDGTTWEATGQAQVPAQPEKKKRRWLKWAAIGTGGLLVLSFAMNGQGGESTSEEAVSEPVAAVEAPIAEAEEAVDGAEAAVTESDTIEASSADVPSEETAPESDVTLAQESALRSAESYLEFSGFSKQGLIDQLTSEYADNYSVEDATWAVNQLDVNWNEQAVRSAESYLEFSGFSRQGMIDQLTSEYADKYTVDQATYAVDTIGL